MSKNNNTSIWAKSNNLSLKQHTTDILEIFETLSKNEKLSLSDELKNCIKLAIVVHDFGKVLPYFQIVTLGNSDYIPWDIDKLLNIYHSLASILFINKEKLKEKVGNENSTYVLSAIAYHHWKSSLENDLRFGADKFEKLLLHSDDFKDALIKNLGEEMSDFKDVNEIIALDKIMLGGLTHGLSFAEYVVPPYQLYWLPKRLETEAEGKKIWILISGFLQRCDHYASFCEEGKEELEKVEINGIKSNDILKNIKEEIRAKLNSTNKQKNSNQISLWQENYFNNVSERKTTKTANNVNYKDKNIILIAPTGCGKTEFAFLWSNGEKFFYTLPLRAAVEQIYDRATKIFGEEKTGLLHSDADVYLLGDDYNYEKIRVYDVAKQLSYPAIISTGDQFFPYGLRPPGYERIYATFSYSRLVIDEIQAYDPRAAAIIVKFIEDIVLLGGKFLLMTATLPEYVKKEIEDRIKDDNNKNFEEVNIYEKEKNKYKSLQKHTLSFVTIKNNKKDNKNDFTIPDNIIQQIVSSAQNQRVLVILNTVKQAESVYERIVKELKNNSAKNNSNNISNKLKKENIFLLHSRFTINQKNTIKQTIEKEFKNPKDSNNTEGKILVATQVVEAAIDIDADVLYTEICPMDALVQRMGRVLRRYKENYTLKKNSEPNVFVFIFENGYESGNGRVYDRELVEKTLIYVNNPEFMFKKVDLQNKQDNNSENSDTDNPENPHKNKSKKRKNKEDQFDLKKLNNLNNKEYKLLLSEYKKLELVNKLYESLDPAGKYLSKFYETLSILDAGFMSDRREEAQRIFREIMNVSVIDVDRKEEFLNGINKITSSNHLNYTKFKKDIIAEFVFSIPYYNLGKIKIGGVLDWLNEIKFANETQKRKVQRWCEDIFIVNFKIEKDKKVNFDNIL